MMMITQLESQQRVSHVHVLDYLRTLNDPIQVTNKPLAINKGVQGFMISYA